MDVAEIGTLEQYIRPKILLQNYQENKSEKPRFLLHISSSSKSGISGMGRVVVECKIRKFVATLHTHTRSGKIFCTFLPLPDRVIRVYPKNGQPAT